MTRMLVAACCVFAWASPAHADVVDSSAGGFTVKTVVQISAPAMNVYRALVDRVWAWWESSHTFSGSASNLSLCQGRYSSHSYGMHGLGPTMLISPRRTFTS